MMKSDFKKIVSNFLNDLERIDEFEISKKYQNIFKDYFNKYKNNLELDKDFLSINEILNDNIHASLDYYNHYEKG